jgi:hypothetical protein
VTSSLDARIEVARGEMVIGDTVVPMRPHGAGGEWRVGGSAGPVLRPLRYGERTRLCALAAMSREPHASLGAAVAGAATVADGELGDLPRQVAALLMCGAREPGASFSETTLRVARAAGWDPAQITETDATEIDRLAVALGATARESGWHRLVLDSADADVTIAIVRDQLADRLLSRVDDRAVINAEQPAPFDAPTAAPTGSSAEYEASSMTAPPVHVWPEPIVVRRVIATPGDGTHRESHDSTTERRPAVVVADSAWAPQRATGPGAPARWARPAMSSDSPSRDDRHGQASAAVPVVPKQPPRRPVQAAADPMAASFVDRSVAEFSPLDDAAVHRFAPDVADALALLLDEEADLRGLE